MNLNMLSKEFLEVSGYDVQHKSQDNIVGVRQTIAGEEDRVEIWIPNFDISSPYRSKENPYLRKFREANTLNKNSHRICLVPSYEGISQGFREKAHKLNVNLLVPAFFFDTQFKDEVAPSVTVSAARDLNKKGEEWKRKRTHQPFKMVSEEPTEKQKEDLVELIADKIVKGDSRNVDIIVGPAGMGKSVFFKVLYHVLYQAFQDNKSRQIIFPRPLPLIPEYRRQAIANTLKGLVQGFLHSEFAAPLNYETFVWMLANGFGVWLLDGLDEMIARDPDFFISLEEILGKLGTKQPRVVLCVRDSLLTSNDNLVEFIQNHSGKISIYELDKWDQAEKKFFSTRKLGQDKSNAFLSLLRAHKDLDRLSSIPFYLNLITDLFEYGEIPTPYSGPKLMETSLNESLKREYDEKGLLDRKLIPQESVLEILEELSSEYVLHDFIGISGELITEYTKVLLPTGLSTDDITKLTTHMLQLALFTQGIERNQVHFAQEIFAHYLYGKYLFKLFSKNEEQFIRNVSIKSIPFDWVTNVVFADELQKNNLTTRLKDMLISGALTQNAFRNILQFYLIISDRTVKDLRGINLEQKDLIGLTFENYNLQGTSFRNSNLTDTSFINCNLNNCKFEGALINRTTFYSRKKDDLRGADFGDMDRLYTIRIGARHVETDHARAKTWIAEKTGLKEIKGIPCPAALQLRVLFNKFIDPLGKPKLALIGENDLTSGKQEFDKGAIIEATVKYGYISHDIHKHRYVRCEGDLLTEMRNYVLDLRTTPRIQSLLNDTCPNRRCPHLLPQRS